MPPLFAPAEQVLPVVQSQPSLPKLKIKDIKPDDKSTKIVIKNLPVDHHQQQQYPGASNIKSNILKRPTLIKPQGAIDEYGHTRPSNEFCATPFSRLSFILSGIFLIAAICSSVFL